MLLTFNDINSVLSIKPQNTISNINTELTKLSNYIDKTINDFDTYCTIFNGCIDSNFSIEDLNGRVGYSMEGFHPIEWIKNICKAIVNAVKKIINWIVGLFKRNSSSGGNGNGPKKLNWDEIIKKIDDMKWTENTSVKIKCIKISSYEEYCKQLNDIFEQKLSKINDIYDFEGSKDRLITVYEDFNRKDEIEKEDIEKMNVAVSNNAKKLEELNAVIKELNNVSIEPEYATVEFKEKDKLREAITSLAKSQKESESIFNKIRLMLIDTTKDFEKFSELFTDILAIREMNGTKEAEVKDDRKLKFREKLARFFKKNKTENYQSNIKNQFTYMAKMYKGIINDSKSFIKKESDVLNKLNGMEINNPN